MFFKLTILYYLLELKLLKRRYGSNFKALQNYRWKKFQSTLAKSPFYSELANQNTALENYPLMNKQVFMEQFDRINIHGITKEAANKIAYEAETSRVFSDDWSDYGWIIFRDERESRTFPRRQKGTRTMGGLCTRSGDWILAQETKCCVFSSSE